MGAPDGLLELPGLEPSGAEHRGSHGAWEHHRLASVANSNAPSISTFASMQALVRMTWGDGMPLGRFRGVRSYDLAPCDAGRTFSMTEELTGPLSGLIANQYPT